MAVLLGHVREHRDLQGLGGFYFPQALGEAHCVLYVVPVPGQAGHISSAATGPAIAGDHQLAAAHNFFQ